MDTNFSKFIAVFEDLPDPRHHRTRRHELLDILFIAICSALTGGKSFIEMEDLAEDWKDWFKQFIPMVGGVPSHDTFNRVFQMLDPLHFEACFRAWTQSLMKSLGTEIIAIDGKTNRGSGGGDKSPIHLVNALACENRLILGQLQTETKSNEITAVPELLRSLFLKKTVVTVDAMNCQKQTASTVIEGGGDYVFALKKNHPLLYEDVKLFVDELSSSEPAHVESLEKGHGRIETRRYWQSTDIEWFEDKAEWPGLKSFGMVHSVRELSTGKRTEETRYYISSLSYNPELFAKAVRSHWGIENKVHWSLDVTFGEDQNRARTKNASRNLSILRKIALNITKKAPGERGLNRKMRAVARNPNYLLELLKLDA